MDIISDNEEDDNPQTDSEEEYRPEEFKEREDVGNNKLILDSDKSSLNKVLQKLNFYYNDVRSMGDGRTKKILDSIMSKNIKDVTL